MLVVKRRTDLAYPNLTIMWVEVKLHNNQFLLGVICKPPDSGMSFWDYLRLNVEIGYDYKLINIIITGDPNADPRTYHGKKLAELGIHNNLKIHIPLTNRNNRINFNLSGSNNHLYIPVHKISNCSSTCSLKDRKSVV